MSNDPVCALLNDQFDRLHRQSTALIQAVPHEKLYWQPRDSRKGVLVYSCAEHILRSAGAVEQTFGGISTNLWDDPFEWTLPETLSSVVSIIKHLEVVEATRQSGFELFGGDDDLFKEIVVPTGETVTIFALLLDTLVRAAHHNGCAFATLRLFSDERIPRV